MKILIETRINTMMNDEIKKYFKPEFLNRIDDIIIFNSINLLKIYIK